MTHPGPGVRDRPSIASLVSSFDATFSRYAAFTKVQSPRVEVIEELEDMFLVRSLTFLRVAFNLTLVQTALRYFHHVNHVTPRRIIFYRDGVSEGEYQTVEEIEIRAISGKGSNALSSRIK